MMTTAVARWQRDQMLSDLRAARICSILTSTTDKPHPPQEFMIDYVDEPSKKPEPKRQTPEEMAAVLQAMATQFGANNGRR